MLLHHFQKRTVEIFISTRRYRNSLFIIKNVRTEKEMNQLHRQFSVLRI